MLLFSSENSFCRRITELASVAWQLFCSRRSCQISLVSRLIFKRQSAQIITLTDLYPTLAQQIVRRHHMKMKIRRLPADQKIVTRHVFAVKTLQAHLDICRIGKL